MRRPLAPLFLMPLTLFAAEAFPCSFAPTLEAPSAPAHEATQVPTNGRLVFEPPPAFSLSAAVLIHPNDAEEVLVRDLDDDAVPLLLPALVPNQVYIVELRPFAQDEERDRGL
jgi:hypothetical protein